LKMSIFFKITGTLTSDTHFGAWLALNTGVYCLFTINFTTLSVAKITQFWLMD
jgi:hypothetical protein